MRRLAFLLTSAAVVAMGLNLTPASADSLKDVAREKTLIFENIEGRVPVPDNMNPYPKFARGKPHNERVEPNFRGKKQ